ncbi:MAG: 16S rRNA (cytosine(1402)-N(4))-methyltransferase RsmH [Candidatus Zixiibacteriota bacterium]|nr:MAG: 16S rRNA (cytosine(1402)-N(4))-methyltransferase RsmH [candidate division Zixibacteria bacterium]
MTSTTGRKNEKFHRPVLVEETARYLVSEPGGTYLDLTCGGGGHLRFISRLLDPDAVLIGIDRDPDAVTAAQSNLKSVRQKVTIVNNTFSRLDGVLAILGIDTIDGVLFDLGVSSHQIDTSQRGFSFMQDGPLDMRMGVGAVRSAGDVVNEYSEEALAALFRRFGEEKRARKAAAVIVKARRTARITTTGSLRDILVPGLSPKHRNASLARLFQAIRIEVNRELDELEQALPKALDRLAIGGRMVVISYHSLEDRIVKQFLARGAKGCTCPPEFPVCVCGKTPQVALLTKRVVKPSEKEIEENRRASPAKLRAAEKLRQ